MALLTITTPRGSVTQIKNGNGAVTARLQWDPAFGARHTQSFLRTQAFIDSEVLRLMSPYTPLQTSMLIKRSKQRLSSLLKLSFIIRRSHPMPPGSITVQISHANTTRAVVRTGSSA